MPRERFRASFEDALLPLWLMDLEQRYTEVNDAYVRLLGHPREQLLGARHLDFVHPDERELDAEGVRLVCEGTLESSLRETRLVRADGSAVWVAVAIAGVSAATGVGDTADRPAHLIGQAFDTTARRQHEEQLRHLADHDPLTGLMNRRGFDRELRRHVSRTDRYGAEGALLMLDLDDFKQYNDGHGHAAGDQLLRSVAAILNGRLRSGDIVGRIGGDEFAVLLPKANSQQAETVAAALVKAIGDADHNGHRVTVSIGVFNFAPGEPASESGAMVGADAAMYNAKNAGRNGYAPFDGRSSASGDTTSSGDETAPALLLTGEQSD